MGFPPVEALLPHRPPMLLVDRVVELAGGRVVCAGRIPAGNPLVDSGQAPAILALELAAQTAGVHLALTQRDREPAAQPAVGFLVAIRDGLLAVHHLAAGSELRATADLVGSAGPVSIYQVTVRGDGGSEVASARVSLYVADGSS